LLNFHRTSISAIFSTRTKAIIIYRGRHGNDHMVDGFTTTLVISAYHH